MQRRPGGESIATSRRTHPQQHRLNGCADSGRHCGVMIWDSIAEACYRGEGRVEKLGGEEQRGDRGPNVWEMHIRFTRGEHT